MTDSPAARGVVTAVDLLHSFLYLARVGDDAGEGFRNTTKGTFMQFTKATKAKAKGRVAFMGPSGSGKTYSSLRMAKVLAGDKGRIAVIDSERGSASKYADEFDFDVLELDSFSPDQYVDAIHAAENAGYAVIVIDSLTHAWSGKDGALEQVDKVKDRSFDKNSFNAWRSVTPMHNAMVDAMLQSPCHIIATCRVKTEYVMEKDEKTGKTKPRKVGLAPIQRDGLEYEFDLIVDIDIEHKAVVGKTRCKAVDGEVWTKPGPKQFAPFAAWLTDGAEPVAKTPKPNADDAKQALVSAMCAFVNLPQDDPAFSAQAKAVIAASGIKPKGNQLDATEMVALVGWINKQTAEGRAWTGKEAA